MNDDFEVIRILNSGTFGYVSIVRRISTNVYYCRKSLSKRDLIQTNKVNDARKEKKLLGSLRFAFTIHLKHFYHDSCCLHFILPLLVGGDLFGYLKTHGRLHERLTKFIAAQILLALEYLHIIGLIHRDLKLESILIDHEGYVKITNFGMCKLINHNRTYTICGTAEYMAPEVIANKGYGLAADWWSFGILIYELCNGLTPFFADETIQIFNLIAHCDYAIPVHFSSTLSDLITKLLQPDLTKRFGNLQKGVEDIKNHFWFRDMPWLSIINKDIISPMIPFIADKSDMQFFAPTPEPSFVVDNIDLFTNEFQNF
ncbi:hypothetical protein O3M35_012044 [Rhynocoris fuscipes]|uniref:Uncharacterized protein n=1 Tax=Rhynocoris fuscipes TaxID=488301 RepID=A0AAW1CQZ5_9HEMI